MSTMTRIIPARAGFTQASTSWGWQPRDHPRSRGVYVYHTHIPAGGEGSSPLARGLRAGGGCGRREDRIIPARAGFTTPTPTDLFYPPDHPRSRGVYLHFPPYGAITRGSSPLARGLHPHGDLRAVGVWIIPARAGFTFCVLRLFRVYGDHPRSRGVYCSAVSAGGRGRGSSPLARGLRVGWVDLAVYAGIIPARAGFTREHHPGRGRRRDHPRSRGVYREW